MVKVIGTLTALGKDYRSVLKTMKVGYYYNITSITGDKPSVAFRASFWLQETDAKKSFIDITSRDMKDQPVFYLNVARYWQVRLRISAAGRRYYLLEPQASGFRNIAERVGGTPQKLREMILAGPIGSELTEENERLLNELESKQEEHRRDVAAVAARIAAETLVERDEQTRRIDLVHRRQENIENLNRTIAVYRRRLSNAGLSTSTQPLPGE
jgi:hypothetical protein